MEERPTTENPRIHLRKPIAGLRISYFGPEAVPAEEAKTREDAAYAKGKRDAEIVCQRQIVQARADMANLQNRTLSAIEKNFKDLCDQFDEEMPELVMTIVGKVFEGIKLTRDDVARAIDSALTQTGSDTQNLAIRLSNADFDLLQDTSSLKSRYPDLIVETDPELKSGDVVIRSRFGTIDSRVETKLRRIGGELAKAHK
jgi:flagellar biosynthesis/type III secretory pathway protein FliH